MRSSQILSGVVFLFIAGLILTGCPFKVDEETITANPLVIFDTDSGVVPQPNKLVIDSLLATLAADPNAYDPAFKSLIETYLATSGGSDLNAPLEFTVRGQIDAKTLTAANVRMLDISALMAELQKSAPDLSQKLVTRITEIVVLSVTYDATKNQTELAIMPKNDPARPDDGWAFGHHYLILLTDDIKSPDGLSLIGDQAFNFMKATSPLLVNGISQVSSLVPLDLVKSLEAARSGLFKPVLDYMESDAAGDEKVARTKYGPFWYFNIRTKGVPRVDLTNSDIPTPNDLLLNPSTGLLSFPYCEKECDALSEICQVVDGASTCVKTSTDCDPACTLGFSCVSGSCVKHNKADNEAFKYLNTLDGWSFVGAITLRFDKAIDTTTIDGNFKVYDVTDPANPKEVPGFAWSYDAAFRALSMAPPAPLTAGNRYMVYFTNKVKDADGQDMLPSLSSALLRLKDSLIKTEGDKTLSTVPSLADETPEDIATLQQLEGLRKLHDTYLTALETAKVVDDRHNLLAFWVFSVGKYFEAGFNPGVPSPTLNPFPNDTLIDQDAKNPDGTNNPHFGKVNLPVVGSDSQKALITGLRELDGYSPLQPTTVPLSQKIDLSTFSLWTGLQDADALKRTAYLAEIGPNGGAIAVVSLADKVDITFDVDSKILSIAPKPGMNFKPGYRYIFGLTKDLKSDTGAELMASPVFHLIRGKDKLYNPDLNVSLTRLVENPDTALSLETLRSAYELQVFGVFSSFGATRDRTVLIWTTTMQSVAPQLESLRKFVFDTWTETQITASGTLLDPAAATLPNGVVITDIDQVVTDGKFSALTMLDDFDATKGGSQPFMREDNGDLKSKKQDLGFVLATPKTGTKPFPVVVFSHGISGTKEDAFKIANALAKEGFATIAIDLAYFGSRTPAGTQNGTAFLNPNNPFAIRDAIRQSAIDNVQLIRSLAKIDAALGGSLLDTTKVHFLGTSLGAMVGTLTCAVEPAIKSCALNNAAGHLTRLLTTTESDSIKKPFVDGLTAQGITTGSPAFFQTLTFLQQALDRGDPMNFAAYLINSPLADTVKGAALTPKPILMQLGKKDAVFPNALTQAMFTAVKKDGSLATLTEYDNGCHTFLTDPGFCTDDATANRTAALTEITTFFKANND